ncbi:hypothetical protein RE9431_09410 [Prescottella equi]|nr:hypothetical protein RE9431_09410 [Prescottella equi]BCN72339.1 hypothetical protein RE0327_09380 [Prescottella equi]
MAQQFLDDAEVGSVVEERRAVPVAEAVRRALESGSPHRLPYDLADRLRIGCVRRGGSHSLGTTTRAPASLGTLAAIPRNRVLPAGVPAAPVGGVVVVRALLGHVQAVHSAAVQRPVPTSERAADAFPPVSGSLDSPPRAAVAPLRARGEEGIRTYIRNGEKVHFAGIVETVDS